MLSQLDHVINPQLLRAARTGIGGFSKLAFVPGADMSGAGGAPAGGDPSQGGGAPPQGGGGGGDPTPPGGGGGDPAASLMPMVQQMVQQQMQQMGGGMGMGGGAGAGGKNPLTPKIDEKAVLLQILKIQARIADQLGVKIPASEMVVTQSDMQGLAQASSSGAPMPGMDPSAGGGTAGGAGAGGGAIAPIDPMQGAGVPGAGGEKAGNYRSNGVAFDRSQLADVHDRAAAIGMLRRNRPRVAA